MCVSVSVSVSVCVCVCVCVCIYIYIYWLIYVPLCINNALCLVMMRTQY